MSELGRLIKIKEELNKAEITILKQIDDTRNAHIEQVSDIPKLAIMGDNPHVWVFDKPIQVNTIPKDNLSLILYNIEQSRKDGNVEYVTMSGKTLRDLTLSPTLYEFMEKRKIPKVAVIDKAIIELVLNTPIIVEPRREGILIHTTKDTTVTWD